METASPPPNPGDPREARRRRGKRRRFGPDRDPPRASEILVTNRDGSTKTVVRARPWTEWLKNRVESESPGIESATLIREMTRQEYLAIKPAYRKPADGPEPEGDGHPPKAVSRPRAPGPSKALPAPDHPAKPPLPYAWEVLYRRHGKVSTKVVVCADEAGAVGLMAQLDGVEAATSIRPLTLEEYRQTVR